MWGKGSTSFFCMWISSCPRTMCWTDYYFLIEMSWNSYQKSVNHKYKCLFLDFSSIPLIHMSILMQVPQCLDYCSFVVNLQVRTVYPQTLFFSRIPWLFLIPCISIWILWSICQFWKKKSTFDFGRACIEFLN